MVFLTNAQHIQLYSLIKGILMKFLNTPDQIRYKRMTNVELETVFLFQTYMGNGRRKSAV